MPKRRRRLTKAPPNLAAIVLAGGEGKRMRSRTAKVLHPVGGRPMIDHVLATLEELNVGRVVLITGHGADQVERHVGPRAECVLQKKPSGTGHAVLQARPRLARFDGWVIVASGDSPLWRAETLRGAIAQAREHKLGGLVLTTRVEDPTGYGRVIRGHGAEVMKIVEEGDASEDEKLVREINGGAYCFRARPLFEALPEVKNDNAQGEYYLTDVIEILIRHGHRVQAHLADDADEALGVNSRADLAVAEAALQRRLLRRLMEGGVTIVDPRTTWVEADVTVGRDTVLYPLTILRGRTRVAEDCRIGPSAEVIDAEIGPGAVVRHSVVEGGVVAPGERVGPFKSRRRD